MHPSPSGGSFGVSKFSLWAYPSIAAIGFLLYFHTLSFGFTYFDDTTLVLGTYNNISADPAYILRVFTQNVFPMARDDIFYRPVLLVSFILDAYIGGARLFTYHLTNLILHIMASCLVLAMLLKLTYDKKPAFLLSVLFMVHPMLTQAVAFIPGRNDSLLAVFSILAFITFLNFTRTGDIGQFSLHALFLLLALCTKETAVALIPVCYLYTRLISKQKLSSIRGKLPLAGWALAVALWYLLRHEALKGRIGIQVFDVIKYTTLNLPVMIQYIGRIFFPIDLSVWPIARDSNYAYGFIAIAIIALMLLFSKKRRSGYIIFGISWFILFLLPALARPNSGPLAYFLNYRVYLPMIGILIIIMETDLVKKISLKKPAHIILISSLLLVYSSISFNHSYDFQGKTSFWSNARRTSPHFWLTGAKEAVEISVSDVKDRRPK